MLIPIFEDRVLRGMFEHKREDIRGGSEKSDNDWLKILYSSLNIIRVIKSRKVSWGEACSMHRRNDKFI
jgi:hypothetical protein